jgi:LPS export ABC transporter protein LptC
MKLKFAPFALVLCLLGCQKQERSNIPNPAPSEPDEVLFNSTINLTSRGMLTSKIKADKILRFEDREPMVLYKIDAFFYDSTGKEEARVKADSGTAVERTNFVQLRGKVKVTYANGTVIDTDSLKWDQAGDKVTTDGFVKIVKKDGSELEGEGLITDPQFTSYRIIKPVGSIRVDEEEK